MSEARLGARLGLRVARLRLGPPDRALHIGHVIEEQFGHSAHLTSEPLRQRAAAEEQACLARSAIGPFLWIQRTFRRCRKGS